MQKEKKDLVIYVNEDGRGELQNQSWKQLQQGRCATWEVVANMLPDHGHIWHLPKSPESPPQVWLRCNPSPQHILSGCKTAQDRYKWRHDQVLHKLIGILKARRLEANRTIPVTFQQLIHFVRQGGHIQSCSSRQWSLLSPGEERSMTVDLVHQLIFAQVISSL